MPANCGNGRTSCCRGTVAPLNGVPGSRPWNGLATGCSMTLPLRELLRRDLVDPLRHRQAARAAADVGRVERQSPGQLALHADRELVHVGNRPLRIGEREAAADQRGQPLRVADRLIEAGRDTDCSAAPTGVMPPSVDATSVVVTLKPLL